MATKFFEGVRSRHLKAYPSSLPKKREPRPEMSTEAYMRSLSSPDTTKNIGFGSYAEMGGNAFTGQAQGQLVMVDMKNGSRVSQVAHVVMSGVAK